MAKVRKEIEGGDGMLKRADGGGKTRTRGRAERSIQLDENNKRHRVDVVEEYKRKLSKDQRLRERMLLYFFVVKLGVVGFADEDF